MNKFTLLFIILASAMFSPEGHAVWSMYMKKKLQAMPELKSDYPQMPDWNEGTVLMVYAHADDELGVVAQVARMQRKNPKLNIKWVMVSDNAEGVIFPGTCGKKSKAECRLREAHAAAKCMGIPAPISLNLPDGGLDKIPNLASYLKEHVKEFDAKDLRAVISNDFRGLYGHADHVAVHDAVAEILKGRNVPLIGMAVPEFIRSRLPMRSPGKERSPMPITHALDLNREDAELKGCVVRAHRSQIMTLRILMLQFLKPEDVYTWAPREFFTIME